jgi:hypothetical protein
MEVHHHPQIEKKRFKEYLLEGIMIFIAVTLGFFSESLREHINNNEKENEYILGLVNNLEQDKEDINNTIQDNQKKLSSLDSLLSLASKNLSKPINKHLLYKYSVSVPFYSAFSSNNATMIQLKNAGGLQYIRHDHIADSIARYDEVIRSINAAETPYAKAINDAMDALSEIILFEVWHDTTYLRNIIFTNNDLPFLTNNPQKINVFFNKIFIERAWTQNYLNNLQDELPYTIRLIGILKKEYDVK